MCAAKTQMSPSVVRVPVICIPADASPVKLQSLDVELSCNLLTVKGRTNVGSIVQKPSWWIDLRGHINALGSEPVSARRCKQPKPFATTCLISQPVPCMMYVPC